ncbi:MAG: MoaD/ThiS family protein [Clostridiales bacterium]|nr:MoaD/ThiS family protein [Clostridiales bacterium]
MVTFNGTEYPLQAGTSLRVLAEIHFSDLPQVAFEDFVVVVNGAAIDSAQAEKRYLAENDTVYLVPKVDGG